MLPAAAVTPVPPITDPTQVANWTYEKHQHLGGIWNEYEEAAGPARMEFLTTQ